VKQPWHFCDSRFLHGGVFSESGYCSRIWSSVVTLQSLEAIGSEPNALPGAATYWWQRGFWLPG